MFLNRYLRKLTQGGRTAVPEEYRLELGKEFIIALPLSDKECLTIYTKERFEEIYNLLDKNGEDTDVLTAYAVEVTADSQWRFTIPQELRDEKDGQPFSDEVLFVGGGSVVEVWYPDEWQWRGKNEVNASRRKQLGSLYSELKKIKQ